MNKIKERPVNLDLLQIRMPAAAIVSILHRISGVLLILLLPYGIYLFDLSLSGELGFQQVQSEFNSLPGRIILVLLSWLFSHHLCAGVRFLLIDVDIGVSKASAVKGAWLVHLAAVVLTVLIAVVLL